LRYFGV
jgi:hypothetical protein